MLSLISFPAMSLSFVVEPLRYIEYITHAVAARSLTRRQESSLPGTGPGSTCPIGPLDLRVSRTSTIFCQTDLPVPMRRFIIYALRHRAPMVVRNRGSAASRRPAGRTEKGDL